MRILILLLVLFLLDLYVYQAVKVLSQDRADWLRLVWRGSFWITTLGSFALILAMLSPDSAHWSESIRNVSRSSLFIFYVSKLLFAFFMLIDDIRRLVQYAFHFIRQSHIGIEINRSEILLGVALFMAFIPFSSLIYGMVRNPYRYQVLKETIYLPALRGTPDIKIVHISDIHSGSFADPDAVKKGIDIINSIHPDFVFFTGDIVNNKSDELNKYIPIFSDISPKNSVYSVLGNHDYGDYVQWNSLDDKRKNMQQLIQVQTAMGWDLLLDEHRLINWHGKNVVIAGIQNSSGSMRFKSYGNPRKALQETDSADVILLLSHDPSYWESGILSLDRKVDVTFSGHTHGFQFGVEIPGWFKWSPVQYVYKHWAGLYEKENQFLYVNRGFGFLGYPGRVGILPEITEITLTGAQEPL
jgi:uncharacterized protein